MTTALLKLKVQDALVAARRAQEQAETYRLPATRDKSGGMAVAYQRVLDWLAEEA